MEECPICIEHLDNLDHGTKIPLPCGHSFHYECLIKWDKRVCPVCRAQYTWQYETTTLQADNKDPMHLPTDTQTTPRTDHTTISA